MPGITEWSFSGPARKRIMGLNLWGVAWAPTVFCRRTGVRKWQCVVCGFIYDEAEGWPEDGIEPGTAWEDVPEDWECPDCGVGKEDFEMIEIG